jgi:hypothetical protein
MANITTSTFIQGTTATDATFITASGSFPISAQMNIGVQTTSSTATIFDSRGYFPISAQMNIGVQTTSSTATIFDSGGSYVIRPVIAKMNNTLSKVTSTAENGYGNLPVSPLGEPLTREYWL